MRDPRKFEILPDKFFKSGEADGTLNEYKVLAKIRQVALVKNHDLRMLDLETNHLRDDLLQEVRTAMVENFPCHVNGIVETAYSPEVFKVASRVVHACLVKAGWYKVSGARNKHGKETRFAVNEDGDCDVYDRNCICGYGSVMPELCECGMDEKSFSLAKDILDFYETHSAEETCAHFGVERSRKIEKALMSAMPKQAGAGKGGKRENSGRKKETHNVTT